MNIRHEGQDEFGQLYDGFNRMKERIGKLIDEVYVQTSLAQRAQLKQLQAQINPHFLYNSFFILSRRIKRGDYDNAVEIAEHLGDYFRFLTRNESDYIPLRREVEHAQSYAAVQAARFVDRITGGIRRAARRRGRNSGAQADPPAPSGKCVWAWPV